MSDDASRADRALIEKVHRIHGIDISPHQLERWRLHGLLPRVEVLRGGCVGTRVRDHDDEVLRAAALLGSISGSGRAWKLNAERLFNEEFPLTDAAVRAAAEHVVTAERRKMWAAWKRAERWVTESNDPEWDAGVIGDVAAREYLPKYVANAVRNEIKIAHQGRDLSDGELIDLGDNALTWRMVDLVEPSLLDDGHRNLARHGIVEAMRPQGDGVYPLPSERLAVAQTLTWAEAEQYRPFAQGRTIDNSALKSRKGKTGPGFGLLDVTIWIVTYERLKVSPNNLTLPLPKSQLDEAAKYLSLVSAAPFDQN